MLARHRAACDSVSAKLVELAGGSTTLTVLALLVGEVLGLIGHQCAKLKEWLLTRGMDGLKLIRKIVDKARATMKTFRTAAEVGAHVVEFLGSESKDLPK